MASSENPNPQTAEFSEVKIKGINTSKTISNSNDFST